MLSVDLLYPSCPSCDSNVFVDRQSTNRTFQCRYCETKFDDAEFDVVFSLDRTDERLYILRRHGGYPFSEIAVGTRYSSRSIKTRYHQIEARVNRALRNDQDS